MEKIEVDARLLLRIATDLKKEIIRHDNPLVKRDLEEQINGLLSLHKELEDFRTIKRLLSQDETK